ncbi:MAG: RsmE family RNA methyltransferase [Myxococcota bacterium]
MSLRRVRVDHLSPGENVLPSQQEHYLARVLRLRDGDPVELFDGQGNRGHGQVVLREDRLMVQVDALEADPRPAVALTVAAATPKGDRADWLVEKIAELGAVSLQWIDTERSVVKLQEGSKKLERFARLADSAARQSGQSWTLAIHPPLPFDTFLAQPFDAKWIAHPGGTTVGATGPGSIAVLIGPEGGFTDDEVTRAQGAGYMAVSLADTILRVETAAVAATVLVHAAAKSR